ncbi:hypothetical protein [uncultured Sunxiuqinia sp.]
MSKVHFRIKHQDFKLKQCFFWEYLLSYEESKASESFCF